MPISDSQFEAERNDSEQLAEAIINLCKQSEVHPVTGAWACLKVAATLATVTGVSFNNLRVILNEEYKLAEEARNEGDQPPTT